MTTERLNNVLSFLIALVLFLVGASFVHAQDGAPGTASLIAPTGEAIVATGQNKNIIFATGTDVGGGSKWYIDGTTGELISMGGAIVAPGTGSLLNDTFLTGRNFADTLDIGLIKSTTADDTLINSDVGNVISFSPGGVLEFSFDNDLIIPTGTSTTFRMAADANRLFAFSAPSDTSLSFTSGDSVTANQVININTATLDGTDTSRLNLLAASTAGSGRGGSISLYGEDFATGGDVEIASASGDSIFIQPAYSTTATFSANDLTLASDLIMGSSTFNIFQGAASASSDVTAVTTADPQHFIQGASGTQSQLALLEASNSANPAQLWGFKSRANDGTADTIVQANDDAFQIGVRGADGTDFEPLARITMGVSSASPGNNDMPGRMQFSITPDGTNSLMPSLQLRASATTAIEALYGDGSTNSQRFIFLPGTVDGDDQSRIELNGGGQNAAASGDITRGAYIWLEGNELNTGRAIIGSGLTGTLILESRGSNAVTFGAGGSGTYSGDIIQTAAGANYLKGASSVNADVTARTTAEPQIYVQGASATQSAVALLEASNSVVPVQFYVFKSRATDGSGNTIVQSGDQVLSFAGFGADGTDFEPLADVLMSVSSAAPGNNDMPGRMDLMVTPDGGTTLLSFLNLTATSTTALRYGLGNGTASQILNFNTETSDGADNNVLRISSGGGTGVSSNRGSFLVLEGNEFASSDATLGSGLGSVILQTNGSNALSISSAQASTFTGTVTSSRATDIGWTVVDGANNTACNSICTSACVFGYGLTGDTAFPITSWENCTSAVSDICLCAGAS